jgi:hypothetical protein
MSWNYRIVKYRRKGAGYGLHEVYYDEKGQPWGMTTEPATFVCDDGEEPRAAIYGALLMAQVGARKRPILAQPRRWPGRNPADKPTDK